MTPNRKQRRADGKALRDKCEREAHAKWKPQAKRRDPVELLIESSEGRIPQLVPIRYGRMMLSPFAFYRGAAAIMAADLAHTPVSGIRVQACGDCHLLNFGGFATPERNIAFDINDFDETLPAPWEWDIKRLAASCIIAGQHNGYVRADAREMARRCVEGYREHIRKFAEMSVLERWYTSIHTQEILDNIRMKKWRKDVEAQIARAAARTVLEHDFPKLATVEGCKARIKDNPPLIFHQTGREQDEYIRAVKAAFRKYRGTLSDDRRELLDRFEMKDIAVKVVGVGSVGTHCSILLMMAGDDDALFLQVKEARVSVLEPYAGKSRYKNRGQRVVEGQRLTQAASDIFLGWTEGDHRRHFYLRQLRDVKIKPMIEGIRASQLGDYAGWCGWALARAHAKSGDAAAISGYLGSSPRFDEAVARFAVTYAEQNERDHKALLKAIRDGRITTLEG
jgi:uncharacterized protein (DUF2252 family)